MECREAQEQIGSYLDAELPREAADALRQHIEACDACARTLRSQQELIDTLAAIDPAASASAPPHLWQAIETRLAQQPGPGPRAHRLTSFLRRPLAIAASILLFLGVVTSTVLILSEGVEVAEAARVDYTILLDGLSDRVDGAIERFLAYYSAQPTSATQAHAAAPALSFAIPPELPGGFSLRRAYRLQFGDAPGVAAVYDREEEPLVVFFHPTVDDEKPGRYRQMPCIVGERHGHQVQVGDWRLMHFMDRTTCHCVLTKLDPGSDMLSQIVQIVAPDYTPSAHHRH